MEKNRLENIDILRIYLSVIRCSIHSAVPYMVTKAPIWPLDDKGSWFFDAYIFVVHLFAMELFFVLSGYMFAMQLARKSVRTVIVDRVKRIVVPMLIGIFLFVPVVLSFFYLKPYNTYEWFSADRLMSAYSKAWDVGLANFFPTGHLWFLYYLCLFMALVMVYNKLADHFEALKVSVSIKACILFGIVISIFSMYFMKRWIVDNPLTFLPEWPSLLHYFIFFLFGIALFNVKSYADFLREKANKMLWIGFVTGVVALVPQMMAKRTDLSYYELIRFAGISFSISATYLITLGLWGKCLQIKRSTTQIEKYFAGASYWIYLSNMVFVLIIQLILIPLSLNVFLKFGLTLIGGIGLSTLTYHVFVRRTWFGSLLSMRKR